MFESLSNRLKKVFSSLSRKKNLTEANIAEALVEIKQALLASDVSFEVVQKFIEEIKTECIGQRVFQNVEPGQQVVKLVHDKLISILGDEVADLDSKRPLRILMVGLNGAGKTTSSAKLAQHLKSLGEKPCLIACDLQRPAAIEQLKVLGQQIEVPVLSYDDKNVLEVGQKALKNASEMGCSHLIFDTAGRLQIDVPLIEELKQLKGIILPEEILLVTDSALGQEAVNIAKVFNEALGLTGVILTKLDGDAKGGAALSMRRTVQVPIKFVTTGEKINDLEKFYPDRMVNRILGMGDIVSLVEKANQDIGTSTMDAMAQRAFAKDFSMEDFLNLMGQMKKMGPLSGLSKWLPGNPNFQINEAQDKMFKRMEAFILSMTIQERQHPHLLNSTYRRLRIAKGAGLSISDFNRFLKHFQNVKKMFQKLRKMDKSKMQELIKMQGGSLFN